MIMLSKVLIAARSNGKVLFVARWDVFGSYCDVLRGNDRCNALELLPTTDVIEGASGNEIACELFDDAFASLSLELVAKFKQVRIAITYVDVDVMNDSECFVRDSREFVG
jgi:hypothetical protein